MLVQLGYKAISIISHLYTQHLVSISPIATTALTICMTGSKPTFSENTKEMEVPMFVRYSSEILEKGKDKWTQSRESSKSYYKG